ncbi:hypothetical protein WA026_019939 [Henosepilachna vigintioctopunctata]|uniref:Uncharacterized protein n=1 Tax=Henosepilachna vigintioctopunctata TaxID=420089 RepID=A0AAW1V4G4_9CUCU
MGLTCDLWDLDNYKHPPFMFTLWYIFLYGKPLVEIIIDGVRGLIEKVKEALAARAERRQEEAPPEAAPEEAPTEEPAEAPTEEEPPADEGEEPPAEEAT